MDIRPGNFNDPQVIELLRLHLQGMQAITPPESVFALGIDDLNRPEIAFFTAWEGDTLLGCGALRALSAEQAEIKSMRVLPQHQRKGVAAALLTHLLGMARARGYLRVSLETGTAAAFMPAVTLYQRFGFKQGEVFGDYIAGECNQFFHLAIV